MQRLLPYRKWFPLLWVFMAAGILVLDYFAGPQVEFPYLFLIPVALAARFNGRGWGVAFAIILPLSRPCFHLLWGSAWHWVPILSNFFIRVSVLVVAAILIDLVMRQARELKVLKGILPICSYCKKIRTPTQQWEQMEKYITQHSEAKFSHTFCPECAERYYKEFEIEPALMADSKPQKNS